MEHTLLVPPMALVDAFGVSAIRFSARKVIVLDAEGSACSRSPAGQPRLTTRC